MRFETVGRLLGVALLLVLSGCHPIRALRNIGGTCHDPKPYMVAKSVQPLKVPAGLDAADTASALKIPQLNEPAPPARRGTDPCLDEPPAFATPKAPIPQARSIMRPVFGEPS
jgi:uncharacterized lipoprotein